MIEIYAREYIAIVRHFQAGDTGIYTNKRQKMALQKDSVIQLLNKNPYEEAVEKLQIWKVLGWIDTEEGHLTKKVYIKEAGQYRRQLVVNLGVFDALNQLENRRG